VLWTKYQIKDEDLFNRAYDYIKDGILLLLIFLVEPAYYLSSTPFNKVGQ
jgi:hypothetical protein